MSQVRRLEQIPAATSLSASDQIAVWQDGRTRTGRLQDIIDAAVAGAAPLVPVPSKTAIGLGNVDNTSDATKAATGNPVGDAIAARQSVSFTQTTETDAVAMPLVGKLREFAFLGDRKSISGNGTSDDTSAVMNEIAYAVTNGVSLIIRDNCKIRLTNTIDVKGKLVMRGQSYQLFARNDTRPNLPGKGSSLFFDHNVPGIRAGGAVSGIGGPLDNQGYVDLRDFGIIRPQPAPVAGIAWAPTPADFDIDLANSTAVIDNVRFLCSTNGIRIRDSGGTQVHFERIFGQVFNSMLQVRDTQDKPYIGTLDHWAFWSAAAEVQQYMSNNTVVLDLQRVDGLRAREVFGIYAKSVLNIGYYNGGSNPGTAGKPNGILITSLNADNCRGGITSDVNAQYAVVDITNANLYQGTMGNSLGASQTPDHMIDIPTQNLLLNIGCLHSNNVRGSHAKVYGAGSKLHIGKYFEGTYNGQQPVSGASSAFPGLWESGGAEIIVDGAVERASALTAQFTSYPINASGSPRTFGRVRMLLEKGVIKNAVTDGTNGVVGFGVTSNQIPATIRLDCVESTDGSVASLKFAGKTATTISVQALLANGAVAVSKTITFRYELWSDY